ncbi:MAG: hypothetical protein ACRCZO_11235, partial [Cetobacterium sp.]
YSFYLFSFRILGLDVLFSHDDWSMYIGSTQKYKQADTVQICSMPSRSHPRLSSKDYTIISIFVGQLGF